MTANGWSPLPSKREGPRHRPLATTSLSHSDAKGRVTAHSPPPPSPIQTRGAASPPTETPPPPSPIQTPRAVSPPTESPPPPSPIQTRRAASPPTRHHHPLPFRCGGPRHFPLTAPTPPHPIARGRVPTPSRHVATESPPPPSPIQTRRAAS